MLPAMQATAGKENRSAATQGTAGNDVLKRGQGVQSGGDLRDKQWEVNRRAIEEAAVRAEVAKQVRLLAFGSLTHTKRALTDLRIEEQSAEGVCACLLQANSVSHAVSQLSHLCTNTNYSCPAGQTAICGQGG